MFQSADFWKRIIGKHKDIEDVRTWEMSLFELPWQEWFDTKHKFALNDKNILKASLNHLLLLLELWLRKITK